MRLSEIGTAEIQAFINSKRDTCSWWTRKAMKSVIGAIFTRAEDWNYWTGRNPARKVVLGRKQLKRPRRILTDAELVKLLTRLPEEIQLLVKTAVSTGMRISEMTGLRWGRVNLERGTVRVEERHYRGHLGEPKSTDSHRELPLGLLAQAYRERKPAAARDAEFVFNKHGNPLDDRELLREIIRPIAEELGIISPGSAGTPSGGNT